jgi:Ser/Thr protein kinase RdoA (MazF antagonist)
MEVNEAIRSAGAALFDIDATSLKSLEGTDGAVYACRRGNRGYVIKFVPAEEKTADIFEERLRFMEYLAGQGVPIALPLESVQGRLFECLPVENITYLVTLSPLADGRHPVPRNLYDWNDRLFITWGQVMGRMHAAARRYPAWQKRGGMMESIPPTLLLDWQDEHQDFVNWCKEPKIIAKWMPFRDFFATLPHDRSSFGLIHNDLHPFNFFYNPDAREAHPITIIDFDVCTYHWFFTDISIAAYHALSLRELKNIQDRRQFTRDFLSHFMDGYRRENDLDDAWFTHLPAFLKYREILLYIALSNSWPEEQRKPWQKRLIADKRGRTLRDEPVI